MDPQQHKAHRPSKRKSDTKVERHNPKAFTFSGGHISVHRKVQRSAEITQKRLKVDQAADKASALTPPPFIVAVQGPPGCGKSTLIKCLVKHYSKQSVANLNGAAITCVAAKARRLTFIECPSNDLGAMIDLAKVADLAVTMIDARRGIELDTLEFINLMQNHGMPRVMGVLSHLDVIGKAEATKDKDRVVKHCRAIKKLKKKLKQRFWTELYTGAKLFFLSGMKSTKYLPRDVLNLARYISTQKFDPLVWRSQHPHMLMLGLEIDPPSAEETREDTRTIAFTGYVKGSPARDTHVYHIPGCGDFRVKEITTPQDPCLLPKDRTRQLRKQGDAERHIYAPLCEIGTLSIEGSSIFVTLKEDKAQTKPGIASSGDRDALSNAQEDIENASTDDEGSASATASEAELPVDEDVEEAVSDASSEVADGALPEHWQCDFDLDNVWQDDNADEASMDEAEVVQEQLVDAGRVLQSVNSQNGEPEEPEEDWNAIIYQGIYDERSDWQQFLRNGQESTEAESLFGGAVSAKCVDYWDGAKPSDEFIMATFLSLARADVEEADAEATMEDDIFQLFMTPELPISARVLKSVQQLCFATGGWDAGVHQSEAEVLLGDRGDVTSMSIELGVTGSSWTIPVGSFVRIKVEGVPNQWLVENFGPNGSRPVIIGGVKEEENRASFLHGRCRRHRWSPGILKSSEPMLFSVGWRRFQSLPYFGLEDRGNVRNRYLKYTPEHMHCQTYFHGFAAPPGSGIVAIKHMDRALPRPAEMTAEELLSDVTDFRPLNKHERYVGWRISLVGTLVEVIADQPRVMKKIKFLGSVREGSGGGVSKHTAYITGMFNSATEVARSLGVPIQTQAGIRGLIKKADGDKGDYRATFEAPIRPNDVIICKAWYRVPMEPFCNPQMDVSTWDFLRTFGEVRAELNLKVDGSRPDSVYKKLEKRNAPREHGPKIPARLRQALPYESLKLQKDKELIKDLETGTVAIQPVTAEKTEIKYTPYELMVNNLLQKVEKKKEERLAHQEITMAKKVAEHEKLARVKQAASAVKRKEETKKLARKRGLEEKTHRKKMRFED